MVAGAGDSAGRPAEITTPVGVQVRQDSPLGLRQGVAQAKDVYGEQADTFVRIPSDAELKTGDGAHGHARTAVR